MSLGFYGRDQDFNTWDEPSEGWVWTNGINGTVRWKGSFYGELYRIKVSGGKPGFWIERFVYIGAEGFKGIVIGGVFTWGYRRARFLGHASHVCLE